MAGGVFRLTCLLLVLADLHGVQTAASTAQTEKSWKKDVTEQLREIKEALSECTSGLAMSSLEADLQSTKLKLQNNEEELQAVKEELQAVKEELQAVKDTGLKTDQGSTFVRWGRTTCPDNTILVYSGVAGGKQYNAKGGGTNRLCLTRSPQFDNTTVSPHSGHLYGGEYEHLPGHHNHDVPCSVCRAPESTTIMTAGTQTCPPGWTAQYTGHLTSQGPLHYATEYVCLDGDPENDDNGETKNEDGLLFYYVVTVCGSLPCPPYEEEKVVTCVVCSK